MGYPPIGLLLRTFGYSRQILVVLAKWQHLMMSFIHCFARNVKICHRIHPNSIEGAHDKEQESHKMLSQIRPRDTPYISAIHPNFVHVYGHYFARILILNDFKLRKFCLFLQEWRFGRSRSSEVIDFGASRKCVCDFLIVRNRNSNRGPILHHYGDVTAFMCS